MSEYEELYEAIWDVVVNNDETDEIMAVIAEKCWLKDERRALDQVEKGMLRDGWRPVKEIKKEAK